MRRMATAGTIQDAFHIFRKIGHRIGRVTQPSKRAILHSSGLFDETFYRKQLAHLPHPEEALNDPLTHYLRLGGFMGLDPSEEFDSDWYLRVNPDVQAAGVNPLLHYVQHGRNEGRLPYSGAKPLIMSRAPTHPLGLKARLWGGFSHLALPELEKLAIENSNARCAWYLASWHYVHGNLNESLGWLKLCIELEPKGLSKHTAVGLAKCYTQLQMTSELASVAIDVRYTETFGAALPYVLANMYNAQGRQDECLEAINDIFYRAGLVGLTRIRADRPVALDNLKATGPVVCYLVDEAQQPMISVVVPAHNAAGTLPIALEGLLSQSWRNLEVIVVDDGSSDETVAIAKCYAQKDARVRYLENAHNLGAYPTRNRGMKAARGEFVTVHDSDDWSHPQKLEKQMLPLLRGFDKVATVSSWVRVDSNMRFIGPWQLSDHYAEKNHSSIVVRRSVLEEIGYWDEVNVAGDTEFLWRLEQHYDHARIMHVLRDTPLSFALSGEASLTRTSATHVKTIHYGLRRIYRESARWWHRVSPLPPALNCGSERMFPAPLGNLRNPDTEFDAILVGDLGAEGDALDLLLSDLARVLNDYANVCLLHWPAYLSRHGASIADEVFELCYKQKISFAHPGLTLNSKTIVMLSGTHHDYTPTYSARVQGVESIVDANGHSVKAKPELLKYFANGGVQSLNS